MNVSSGNYSDRAACYWSVSQGASDSAAANLGPTTTVIKADKIFMESGINENTRCPYDIVQIGGSKFFSKY